MKRKIALILAVIMIFVLGSCGRTPKEKVLRIVKKEYDVILKACQEKDVNTLLSVNGVSRVKIADGYVVVFCIGKGISVSSQDYGFYYSEENVPAVVDCNQYIIRRGEDLSPEGDGYQCVVNGNTFYTEHINENFYFYSNAY